MVYLLSLGYSQVSPSVMLGSAESEHARLTNRKITFEEFQCQPNDHDTSTPRTDRRADNLP